MDKRIKLEAYISKHLSKNCLSQDDLSSIAYSLGLILSHVFSETDKATGMRSWAIDDLAVDTHVVSDAKLTLRGRIFWFTGDAKCVHYQADIAKNISPLLYSCKFKDKNDKQQMYVGKTDDGWTLRV